MTQPQQWRERPDLVGPPHQPATTNLVGLGAPLLRVRSRGLSFLSQAALIILCPPVGITLRLELASRLVRLVRQHRDLALQLAHLLLPLCCLRRLLFELLLHAADAVLRLGGPLLERRDLGVQRGQLPLLLRHGDGQAGGSLLVCPHLTHQLLRLLCLLRGGVLGLAKLRLQPLVIVLLALDEGAQLGDLHRVAASLRGALLDGAHTCGEVEGADAL